MEMNLILLGGNSSENEPWLRAVDNTLKSHFSSTYVLIYDHWKNGESVIDIDKEVSNLAEYVKLLNNYVIFAKSAGSLVIVKALSEKVISPEKCIFVGVPLDWAKSNNFPIQEWMSSVNIPTLIIQHTNDPFATSEDIKVFLKKYKSKNFLLKQIPGDDHGYHDLDIIENLVMNFLSK